MQSRGTLIYNDGKDKIDWPIINSTLGSSAIDIREIAKTGLYTFDPGFFATANCQSNITFIDGDKGQLFYRGYPIEELAQHSNYLEVCYLLIHKELPMPAQKIHFLENEMIEDPQQKNWSTLPDLRQGEKCATILRRKIK